MLTVFYMNKLFRYRYDILESRFPRSELLNRTVFFYEKLCKYEAVFGPRPQTLSEKTEIF